MKLPHLSFGSVLVSTTLFIPKFKDVLYEIGADKMNKNI